MYKKETDMKIELCKNNYVYTAYVF